MTTRIAAVLVTALAVILAVPAAVSTTPPPPEPCDWWGSYRATLDMLGEAEQDWYVEAGVRMGDNSGKVLTGGTRPIAAVNPEIPCELVETVVVHEWLHLRQIDRYGSWPATVNAMGGTLDAELIADCGTALPVEPAQRPYVEQSLDERGQGCRL